MATMLVRVTVKQGSEPRFEEIAKHMFESTHHHDGGVLRYEYWRGEPPRTYYSLLSFEDHRALIAHRLADHHDRSSPSLKDVCEDIRLEWVDPIQGASPLPMTDHQQLNGDEEYLVRLHADQHPVEVARWWLDLR